MARGAMGWWLRGPPGPICHEIGLGVGLGTLCGPMRRCSYEEHRFSVLS